MSGFAADIKETPQSLWEEQEVLGGRMILTIPFGANFKDMSGFISILGENKYGKRTIPIITLCVGKPAGGAIASTIVFRSENEYMSFIDRLHSDCYSKFERIPEEN